MLLLDSAVLFLVAAPGLLLHALRLDQLSRAQLLVLALVVAEGVELLLFHHLHERLLERLADQNLENRLDLQIEIKQLPRVSLQSHIHGEQPYLAVLNLRGCVNACLGLDEKRRRWAVKEGIGLNLNVAFLDSIAQLLEIQLGLDVDVLAAVNGFWRLGSELLCDSGAGLLPTGRFLRSLNLNGIRLGILVISSKR